MDATGCLLELDCPTTCAPTLPGRRESDLPLDELTRRSFVTTSPTCGHRGRRARWLLGRLAQSGRFRGAWRPGVAPSDHLPQGPSVPSRLRRAPRRVPLRLDQARSATSLDGRPRRRPARHREPGTPTDRSPTPRPAHSSARYSRKSACSSIGVRREDVVDRSSMSSATCGDWPTSGGSAS